MTFVDFRLTVEADGFKLKCYGYKKMHDLCYSFRTIDMLNLIRNHTGNLLYTIPGQLSDVDQLGNLRTFCQYLLFLINWKVSQMTLDH